MADEVKPKRPVPPQFLKKKKEVEQQTAESLSNSSVEIDQQFAETENLSRKEIDMQGLVRDLMHNRYFHIFEKEARSIAEKMVSEGSESLHEIKWFLALSERIQLAKELKEKYELS